jgi:hypothetical protein
MIKAWARARNKEGVGKMYSRIIYKILLAIVLGTMIGCFIAPQLERISAKIKEKIWNKSAM